MSSLSTKADPSSFVGDKDESNATDEEVELRRRRRRRSGDDDEGIVSDDSPSSTSSGTPDSDQESKVSYEKVNKY